MMAIREKVEPIAEFSIKTMSGKRGNMWKWLEQLDHIYYMKKDLG